MKRHSIPKNLSKLKDNDYDVVILSIGYLPSAWFVTKAFLKKDRITLPSGIPIEKITTSNINSWTIHGIWPKKLDGSRKMNKNYKPLFPKGKDFPVESKVIDFIEPALKIMQPNIKEDELKAFLEYQYKKHGCALTHDNGSHYTFNEYLDLSLALFHQYNMNTVLALTKISAGHSYVLGHIYAILTRFLGKRPLIKLAKNYRSGNLYLHEILLYFDKSYKLIDAEIDDVPLSTKVYYAKNADDIINEDETDYPLAIPLGVAENVQRVSSSGYDKAPAVSKAGSSSQNLQPVVHASRAMASNRSVSNVGCSMGINIDKWRLYFKLKLNIFKSKLE